MDAKKTIGRIVSIVLLLNLSYSMAGAANNDVQVVVSSFQGCEIAYSPHRFGLDSLTLNGKQYQVARFAMASSVGETGEPMIPCRVLVVALPPQAGATVSVVASDFEETQGVRLVPVPTLRKEEGLPWEDYREGPAYGESRFLPGVLYEVEGPGYFGDQRVIRIKVYPVQYNPVVGTVRSYTRIVFRVDFEGGVDSTPRRKRFGNEEVYRQALVNHSEARYWRVGPARRLKKEGRVFQSGRRYKIPVSQEGMYKVSGNFFQSHGIDIGSIQPWTLKIYNNGGRELPRDISAPRPDSLIENPILLVGMEDGRFDASDYFLFYGRGVTGWEWNATGKRFDHYINRYTDENVYWLVFNDTGSGQRIPVVSSPSVQDARRVDTFWDRLFLEQEINNPLNAGIEWFGHQFSAGAGEKAYDLNLVDPVADDTLQFRFRFRGWTSSTHWFTVGLNGESFRTVRFSGQSWSAQTATLVGRGHSGLNTLSFQYSGSGAESVAYLDWYEVEYRRHLRPSVGSLGFFSSPTEGVYDYRLSGFSEEPLVVDITNVVSIQKMELRAVSEGWAFVDSVTSGGPKTYLAVQASAYLQPVSIQEDEGSDLRDPGTGADFLVVTHEDFHDEALRLAFFRERNDSLSVFVADIQDVYDAFSGGLFDPTAIRDFVKFVYERWMVRPSYLLLVGDGDYDYRNILSDQDENWIPPFEYDGLTESGSRASDDWFAYVAGNDSWLDLAVGRLPVRSEAEARVVVDKIIRYEENPVWGDWKNLVTVVGDDEKGGQFGGETIPTLDSEDLAEHYLPPFFNLEKIYLTEYPEIIVVEGRRKPEAEDDLVEQINRGTLLVNYMGHGNEDLWAHERVFYRDKDLPRLRNGERLPLFYAATCTFAWYDNSNKQSASEDLLNSEGKGGVGVIGATRFCSALSNAALNKAFVQYLFSETGPTQRLGDALRLAKLGVSATVNNEMYHLLGDPTMRLGVPRYSAVFTSMEPDTFRALSVVRVEGRVERDGREWPDFSGRIALRAFDAKKDVVYTTADGASLSYRLPGNTLYRGEADVDGGAFQVSFIVPKDIAYGGHTGRLSCYFWNGEVDGGGYRDSVAVGGSVDLLDGQGPEMDLFFTGQEDFITGGMVPSDPELVAVIQDDKSGINITGEIGHKMMLTLDDEERRDVTDYFQYEEGSYLQGRMVYQLQGVYVGEHELTLKAWDNANNSSIQSLVFRVIPRGELRVEDVLNYPNPFASSTHFTFKLNQDAGVEIKVFTVDGRLIKRIEGIRGKPGFNIVPPDPSEGWDGKDDMGDPLANGVYLYKVIATARVDGKTLRKEVIGRLMLMR